MKRPSLVLVTTALGALLSLCARGGEEQTGGEPQPQASSQAGGSAPAAEGQDAAPALPAGERARGRLARLKGKFDKDQDGRIGPEEAKAARKALSERLAPRAKAGGEKSKARAEGKGPRKAPPPAKARQHGPKAGKPVGEQHRRAAKVDKKALRIAKTALRTAKIALRKAEAAAQGSGKQAGKRARIKAQIKKHLPVMSRGGERGQVLRARQQGMRRALQRGPADGLPARHVPLPRRFIV